MTQSNPCLLVENPLLCFIQNYRHLPDLGRTIQDFYSPNSVSKAKELLKQYTTSLNRLPLIWPDGILECYDLAINNRCRTRFACANLGQLPVVMKLGNDEAISPTFLLRELRDLRIFLAQALGCHSEEPTYSQQVIPNEEPMVVSDIFPKQQMTNSNSQTLNISVNNDNSFTSSDCSTSTDSKNSTPESPSETQCPIRRKRHRTLDETLEKLSEKKQMVETSQKLENGMPEDASILKSDPCPVSVNPDQSAPPSQKSAQIPILPLPSMSVNTSTRDYLNALNSVRPDLANFCTNLFNQMTVTPLFKPLMKPLDLEEEMKDIEIARGDLNDSEEDEGIMDELGMDEDELEEYDENHESPSPEKDDSTKEKSVETGLEDDDFEPPKRKRGRRRKDEVANDTDSDRIYVCSRSECQKRFANKFLLKKHEFIHTGMKPHICHYCGKGFNRKDNLIRHVRTHEQNPRFCENLMRQNRSLVETINGLFPSLTKSQKNGQKEEDDPNEGLDLHEVNPSESKSSMKIIVDH